MSWSEPPKGELVLTVTLLTILKISVPSTYRLAAFRILLEFISKSAVIVFGVSPSLETKLSKASRRAVKLLLRVVVEPNPDEIVVMVGFLAILINYS